MVKHIKITRHDASFHVISQYCDGLENASEADTLIPRNIRLLSVFSGTSSA